MRDRKITVGYVMEELKRALEDGRITEDSEFYIDTFYDFGVANEVEIINGDVEFRSRNN